VEWQRWTSRVAVLVAGSKIDYSFSSFGDIWGFVKNCVCISTPSPQNHDDLNFA
jgi:hypothetical protein